MPEGEILKSRERGSSDEDDHMSDTVSIDSSITQYRMENGRKYGNGPYWAPIDDKQNENLDISHHKFTLLLDGKLHLAPIPKNIERVLDVGTGTGIWAIDFADEYPDTSILGTDLSPIQPAFVPPNCSFEIDDAREEWLYPENHFDFIHIRSLFGSIDDWPKLYQQAYRHLKPGGYIEQVEISIQMKCDDGTLKPDAPLIDFGNLFVRAGEITGKTFTICDEMKQGITDAGFTNVTEHTFTVAMGGWAADPKQREIGKFVLLGFDIGLEGYALSTLTRIYGWTPAQIQVYLVNLRANARDRNVHSYHEIKLVYAQKPA